ncbi:MAG: metallophosphoesterase family protein [Myxococcales bacterium]|nr:MAG: metallophosphoesterase family protein [Myxococcales bacterium]
MAPRPEYTGVFAPTSVAGALAGVTTAEPHIRRLRLGLGGNVDPAASDRPDPSTSVAIAWQTDVGVTATWVQYGASPEPSSWQAEDRAYGLSYLVPPGKNNVVASEQQLHEVHLCGLTPSTTYYYRVGGGPPGQEVWSEVRAFATTPDPGDDDSEVTLAVTGDSRGQHNNAWQILNERLFKRGNINAQLFSGDIVDLAIFQEQYESWLDRGAFDTAGQPSLFGQVLTLIAMGNHELYNPQFFATVVQPQQPSFTGGRYDELFFSTNIGPVHVVVLDDQRVGQPGADKEYAPLLNAWLRSDLGAVDRKTQPWVVAVHHRGEWTSSNHGDDSDVLVVRDALVPVWDEFKVDLVLNGHDHNYERSKPLHLEGGQPVTGSGTTYVVCAGSGADGYGNGTGPVTAFSARYDQGDRIGVYGLLTASHSRLSFDAHFLTADGTDPKADSFVLTR